MSTLRLVKTKDFSDLIEEFKFLLDPHMEVEYSSYGHGIDNCPMAYVLNKDEGHEMRIIYDPTRNFDARQGIHTTLEIDEYELAEKLERGFDDGFDTIWIH